MELTTKFIDLARQQLLKELIDKRVADLDDWLQQCDVVWKENQTLLPYPKHSTYPTDDEVFARAKILNEIQEQNNKKEIQENVITQPVVEQIKEEVEDIKINSENEKSNTQDTEKIVFNSAQNELPALLKYKRN